jgi:hypothetical protein
LAFAGPDIIKSFHISTYYLSGAAITFLEIPAFWQSAVAIVLSLPATAKPKPGRQVDLSRLLSLSKYASILCVKAKNEVGVRGQSPLLKLLMLSAWAMRW